MADNNELSDDIGLIKEEGLEIGEESSGIGGGLAAYAFTINYIFGAGVLGVPYALAHAGVVVSSITLVLFSAMSCIAMIWVVETCARGDAMVTGGKFAFKAPSANWADLSASFTASFNESSSFHDTPSTPSTVPKKGQRASFLQPAESDPEYQPTYEISTLRLEVGELSEMFLGRRMRYLFDLSVTIFSLVSMWLYAVLFTLSMSETLPLTFIASDTCTYDAGLWNVSAECRSLYWVYLLVFLAMMLATAFVDLSSQVRLQQTLTVMAFVCVLLMVGTVAVAVCVTDGGHLPSSTSNSTSNSTSDSSNVGYIPAATWFDADGFGKAFSAFIFAQLCHHGIPGLIQLVPNKRQCKPIFMAAVSTTTTVYLFLGILCAMYFGQSTAPDMGTNKVISLNWGDYTEGVVPWHDLIRYVVRLYPAVSVTAAFPLYANTLGLNWLLLAPERIQQSFVATIAVRWLAIIPGVVGAALMSDASTIISIGGLFGFMIEMVYPALLSIISTRKCRETFGGSAATPYGWHFSKDTYAYAVLGIAAVAFVYALISLITSS